MTRHTVYDDPRFHAGYMRMRARRAGINEAIEQPPMRRLIGDVEGLDVIDLGCGAGGFCRELGSTGAASVLGVDSSVLMLAEACSRSTSPVVRYERACLEQLALSDDVADLVVSSMALHYVRDLSGLLASVARWLRSGGRLVASMEHPIVSAPRHEGPFEGAWALSDYADEGSRRRRWLGADVPRVHRTTASVVGAVLSAGLRLEALEEPFPASSAVEARPDLAIHLQRPAVLVLAARREAA